METSLDDIDKKDMFLFRQSKRPSDKSFLVAVPMYMYRIKTGRFSQGLNFLEKMILRFKLKPTLSPDRISEVLGLDGKLIHLVEQELKGKKLIDNLGRVTPNGLAQIENEGNVYVDAGTTDIGYVFQHMDATSDPMYDYYISELSKAEILRFRESDSFPIIITGKRGDEEDRYDDKVCALKEVLKQKISRNAPDSYQLKSLIRQTLSRERFGTEDAERINLPNSGLTLSYFPDKIPVRVWLITYVYLPKNEAENLYETDWRVLDPFGHGDSVHFKFYLDSTKDKNFKERIDLEFRDAETVGKRQYNEYKRFMRNEISKRLERDFELLPRDLDRDLKDYLLNIIRNKIEMEQQSRKIDTDSFFWNIGKLLERTFLLNIAENEKEINIRDLNSAFFAGDGATELELSTLRKKRKAVVEELFNLWNIRMDNFHEAEKALLRYSQIKNFKRSPTLRCYLLTVLLSWRYVPRNPIFQLLKKHIGTIWEISEYRNQGSHANFSGEERKQKSKEEINKYYEFVCEFINEYINYH